MKTNAVDVRGAVGIATVIMVAIFSAVVGGIMHSNSSMIAYAAGVAVGAAIVAIGVWVRRMMLAD